MRKFFKQRNILFKTKYGQHKASFSEHFVYLIKKRLYSAMRSEISDNWPALLPYIIKALNQKRIKVLGNIMPSEINSEWDDVKLREAQKNNKVKVYHEPNWETQNQNQKTYLESKKILQPGSYVYVDKKTEVFNKSFFVQVKIFFFK